MAQLGFGRLGVIILERAELGVEPLSGVARPSPPRQAGRGVVGGHRRQEQVGIAG